MKWLEISVDTPPEFVEPLSHVFYRYGHGGVAVEQRGGFNPDEGETPDAEATVRVTTYLPVDSTTDARRGGIDVGVRLVSHLCPISPLRERFLEQEDWEHAWKKHFHVLHVGKDLVIVPTWRDYAPSETDVVIELDPGMAFGTGHHPTTRMCLELLETFARPGVKVLDVGCGSGILSIAAAKLGAEAVVGLEIDSVAAQAAVSNIGTNGVAATVRIMQGTLEGPELLAGGYDLALANISAKVLSELAEQLVSALRPGGRIIASGVLKERRQAVEQRLRDAGAAVERTVTDGDWVAMVAVKNIPA